MQTSDKEQSEVSRTVERLRAVRGSILRKAFRRNVVLAETWGKRNNQGASQGRTTEQNLLQHTEVTETQEVDQVANSLGGGKTKEKEDTALYKGHWRVGFAEGAVGKLKNFKPEHRC